MPDDFSQPSFRRGPLHANQRQLLAADAALARLRQPNVRSCQCHRFRSPPLRQVSGFGPRAPHPVNCLAVSGCGGVARDSLFVTRPATLLNSAVSTAFCVGGGEPNRRATLKKKARSLVRHPESGLLRRFYPAEKLFFLRVTARENAGTLPQAYCQSSGKFKAAFCRMSGEPSAAPWNRRGNGMKPPAPAACHSAPSASGMLADSAPSLRPQAAGSGRTQGTVSVLRSLVLGANPPRHRYRGGLLLPWRPPLTAKVG